MFWTACIHCFVCPRSARTEKTRSGVARMTAVLVKDMGPSRELGPIKPTADGPLSTPRSPANFDAGDASSVRASEGTTSDAGEPFPLGGIDRRWIPAPEPRREVHHCQRAPELRPDRTHRLSVRRAVRGGALPLAATPGQRV